MHAHTISHKSIALNVATQKWITRKCVTHSNNVPHTHLAHSYHNSHTITYKCKMSFTQDPCMIAQSTQIVTHMISFSLSSSSLQSSAWKSQSVHGTALWWSPSKPSTPLTQCSASSESWSQAPCPDQWDPNEKGRGEEREGDGKRREKIQERG